MKSSIFDKDFYFEGLRQSKIAGILCSVILLIGAFFSAFATVIGYIQTTYDRFSYSEDRIFEFSASVILMNPLAVVAFIIFTPILIMNMFSFLNKRNYSDFYHSLPQKRETVTVSYLLAIFTWLFIAVISSTILAVSAYSLIPGVTIKYAEVLPFMFNICAACVLVSGAFITAKSLTGRGISNFVMALLIIFLPRIMIKFIMLVISITTPIVPNHSIGFFEYNIPAGLFLFSSEFYSDGRIVNPLSGIYTLILGIVYLIIGISIMKMRPSETAGNSSNSRTIQAVFRICFAQLFCFIPTALLCSMFFIADFDEILFVIYTVLLLYVSAIVAYILFELITTKKGKNIIRALPGLGILGGVNIIIIVLVVSSSFSVYSYAPSAENIKSVSVTSLNYDAWQDSILFWSKNDDEVSYLSDRISDVKIQDIEFNKIVAYNLKKYKDSKKSESVYNAYCNITVKVGHKDRVLCLSEGEYNTVLNALKNNPQVISVATELPEKVEPVYSYDEDEQEKELLLYESLRQEIKTIDPKKWFEVYIEEDYACYSSDYNDEYYGGYGDAQRSEDEIIMYESISVKYSDGGKNYILTVPITNLTPQTLSLYKTL